MKIVNTFLASILVCITLPAIAENYNEYPTYPREDYRTQDYIPPSEREDYRNNYRQENDQYNYRSYREQDYREPRPSQRLEEGYPPQNAEPARREKAPQPSQNQTFDPLDYTCNQFTQDFEQKSFVAMIATTWGNGYAAKKFGYKDAPPLDKPSLVIAASFFIDLCEKTKANLFVDMLEAWEEVKEEQAVPPQEVPPPKNEPAKPPKNTSDDKKDSDENTVNKTKSGSSPGKIMGCMAAEMACMASGKTKEECECN